MINFGNKKIKDLYYNGKKIKEAYYGSTLVYGGFTPQTYRFDYTGAVQEFIVPKGCAKLIIDAVGAAGGAGYRTKSVGGKGGRVQCKIDVSFGQVLSIYVGGMGKPSLYSSGVFEGGWNGGGSGYEDGASGGGATDIRIGGVNLLNRVVVAGGGGGGAQNTQYDLKGGDGGGLVGGSGQMSDSTYGGTGGTQSEGGRCQMLQWIGEGVGDGGFGYGGNTAENIYFCSGAGGSGYYGGGAAAADGGGGGSSYANQTLCTDVVHTQGYSEATGNGWIIITTSR